MACGRQRLVGATLYTVSKSRRSLMRRLAPRSVWTGVPAGPESPGRVHRVGSWLSLVPGCGSPEVRFDHWRLRITVPRDLSGESRPERIRKAIVAWYRRRAEARLATIVERWWPRFGGREPYRLLIRDQRQRWGSCAPDGTLRFNWRLAMLRPDLAEYVVVHELAHLRVRNHSTEFWNLLSRAMPDAQERRRRLREVGKSLPL